MNAATEWRDILKETCKSVVILIILERIFLTRHDTWLEVRASSRPAARANRSSACLLFF
jgi:hypothetical protein